ncbi:hypothetical protein CMO92_02250 [Candidatus Woesearchaeota archaeon]|nr:hypothetical protein [Candidatus Woesearchaeota archaeon]|tara:strand:- start:746 stop:1519 length:774 start_codon:yes stop_codon:yes gene_type:complete
MWKIEKTKSVKLSNPILIEGMPGIGNVGKLVVDFLIEELKAEKIYDLFSYDLPNSVFVNEKNLIELPKIEIFACKQGKQEILFLTGDVQPLSEESSYIFTQTIIDLIREENCKQIIALGGIGLSTIPQKPKVYITGNNNKFISEFKKLNVETQVYGVVGPIIGVSGLLLGLSKKQKIQAISLLAETFGHPMYLGLRGAREILKIIIKKYNFKINLKELDKEIAEIESETKSADEFFASPKHKAIQKQKKYKEMSYIG